MSLGARARAGFTFAATATWLVVSIGCSTFDSADAPKAPDDGGGLADTSPLDGASGSDQNVPNDAGDSAPPPACDLGEPFRNAVEVAELKSSDSSVSSAAGRLTADSLTIYFFRANFNTSESNSFRVWTASRASRSLPFDEPHPLELQTPSGSVDSHPTITADNGVLFFQRGVGGAERNIHYAKRDPKTGAFSTPLAVQGLSSPTENERTPFVASDESVWITVDIAAVGGATQRIAHAMKLGEGSFTAPELIDLKTPSGAADSDPILTPDLKRIYFASTRLSADNNVWTATRPAPNMDFGPPEIVATVNTTGADIPTWISPDDCELYLSRAVTPTDFRIYRATRSKP